MNEKRALDACGALAHATRMSVFRLLVIAGPDGLPAGEIAGRLGVLQNTLSTHLNKLEDAALISRRRDGRSLIYGARFETVRHLVLYLLEDCCNGHADVCGPVASALQCGATSLTHDIERRP